MGTIVTTDIASGAPLDVSPINNNFSAIANVVNGDLDNSNLSASANIPVSKIQSGATGQYVRVVGGLASWQTVSTPIVFTTGTIFPYAGSSAPTNWYLCDGASIATADAPALFALIGYTFGGGGANFNVPDLRGRVPFGKGSHLSVDTIGDNDGIAEASRSPKVNHGHSLSTVDVDEYTSGPILSKGVNGVNAGVPFLTINYVIRK